MDAVPLVRASAFQPFVQFLEQLGAPVERRLGEVFLPRDTISRPEALIPLDQGFQFLHRNASAEGIPALGLLVGARTRISDLGAFGQLIMRSNTLFDALQTVARTIPLYSSAQRLWLTPWEGKMRFCHRYLGHFEHGYQYGDQFTLMLVIDLIRKFAGQNWRPDEIHLEIGQPELSNGALHVIDAPVRRNSVSAVVFDPALLALPPCEILPNAEGAEERDRRELELTAPARDFVGSMEQIVRMYLTDDRFGLEELAEVAGVGARTLQRQLAKSGEEFSALVDRVRFKASVELLRQGMKFIDVAYELGYSDPAGFTRAFKRWSGTTPSDFLRGRTVN